MKIAIFTDTFTPQINGVAKTLERLTHYFERRNIDYCVFAPQNVRSEDNRSNIQKVKSVPLAIYPECRIALPNPHMIKKKLYQFQPDLIHVATPFNMGLFGRYYARKMKIPLVGSYHTDFDAYLKYYRMDFLAPVFWNYMLWFHEPLQRIFVPSPATLDQLKKKGFRHLRIWGRGIDCTLFHPDYPSAELRENYHISADYTISYVGRLAPEKDIDTLLSVIKTVNEKQVKANRIHWLITGDGPLADEMKKSLAGQNVTFTGYLKGRDLANVYAASDLMVFPSATETFGNVVLEAMAAATPVIGADAGGVKDIIRPGITGALCPPGRAESFAASVLSLIDDDARRKEMSRAARAYALTQSWDMIFDQLVEDYRDALQIRMPELLRANG